MNFIAANSEPLKNTGQIKLHTAEDFDGMRRVGHMAARTLDELTPFVVPGATTQDLDDKALEIIRDLGAVPAPLNYRGFKKSVCTSINHVVCHGIPGDRRLRDGDIMNVDVTLFFEGWHGDHSRMYGLGDVSVKAKRLMDVTYEAMMAGISVVRPGWPWCATFAVTGWVVCSTTPRIFFITGGPAKGWFCAKACFSPSSPC